MACILITGCGSGLGASLAIRLANEGHEVIATVRSLDHKKPKVNGHSTSNLLEYTQMDVTKINEVKAVFDYLAKQGKQLDIVVLNAASYSMGTIESADYERSKQCFEVNYWGSLNVIRSALPIMRHQLNGKIIGIGSISSTVGLPCDGYYSASKAAMERMLESLRYEVAPFGIDVSIIIPAAFCSNLFQSLPNELPESSPYYPLLKHWLTKIQHSSNPQEIDKTEVEDTILRIISTKKPEFIYPVGAMASKVLGKLKVMTVEERKKAILTWSDTTWWSIIDFKGK